MNKKQGNKILIKNKLKVFISSICGIEKYDKIRSELANAIENTQFANVYKFEGEGASTLTAGNHYTFALEDSDVCIFLIDNKDGVAAGVQIEADTVKKHGIKALYYFCDENSKEKTVLEESLIGADFSKITTVHNFNELSKNGAQGLINDIITVYHYYCKDKFIIDTNKDSAYEVRNISIVGTENAPQTTMPKVILKNIDKCKNYILEFSTGYSYYRTNDETEKTSDIDEWGINFLYVLFESKTIKQFNSGMFLECLKNHQTRDFHEVVQIRWKAIQAYCFGDLNKCIDNLKEALQLAKNLKQPPWLIQDILIDLINQNSLLDTIENKFGTSEAQNEISNMNEEFYYPIMDRINHSLNEKYIEGLFDNKTKSPYTVTFGNNFNSYGDLLASSYIVSIYNGSLTHILLIYKRIKEFSFYLTNRYSNWDFRCNMLKLAIFEGNEKEVKGIINTYLEILNNLNSKDALSIMEFCNNHTIAYKQFQSQLLAFGSVGYYLDENIYHEYENTIINTMKEWLSIKNTPFNIGSNILKCLEGISIRMTQNSIAEICNLFFEKHYVAWYIDLYKFFSSKVDLNRMTEENAKLLINNICKSIENDNERESIKYKVFSPLFVYFQKTK